VEWKWGRALGDSAGLAALCTEPLTAFILLASKKKAVVALIHRAPNIGAHHSKRQYSK
jgi:hypothetical protein